jgi:TRAP-type C4-dicarboxylate transport system permease large subunit
VLTYSKLPFRVAEAIQSVAPTWWLFMIFVIFRDIFLGTFLTPSEIILVTVPVLLPDAPLMPFLAAIVADVRPGDIPRLPAFVQ